MQAETVSVGIEVDGTVENGRKVFRSTPAYAARRKCFLTERPKRMTGMTTNAHSDWLRPPVATDRDRRDEGLNDGSGW